MTYFSYGKNCCIPDNSYTLSQPLPDPNDWRNNGSLHNTPNALPSTDVCPAGPVYSTGDIYSVLEYRDVKINGGTLSDGSTLWRYQLQQRVVSVNKCAVCNEPDLPDPDPVDPSKWEWQGTANCYTIGTADSEAFQSCKANSESLVTSEGSACCPVEVCYLPIENNNSCPPGMHNVSTDNESLECVCDNGLPHILDSSGKPQCQKASCPPAVESFPLRATNVSSSQCSHLAGNNDIFSFPYHWIESPSDHISCCYYDGDKPNPCPTNQIMINGECVPIEHHEPDNNDTNPDHTCPQDYYWSINQNKCIPFYDEPDKNNTGGNGNSGNSSGGSGDSNSTGGGSISNKDINITLDLNETNDILRDINASLNRDFSKPLDDLGKKYASIGKSVDRVISTYTTNFGEIKEIVTHLKIPKVRTSGSCHLNFSVWGKSFDLSGGLKMILPVLRPIIMLILNIYLTFLMIKLSIFAYSDITKRISFLFGGK